MRPQASGTDAGRSRCLKLYALLFRVAADFYELVREDWGLFQNWKVHQHTGDVCGEPRCGRSGQRCSIASCKSSTSLFG